MPQSLHWQTLWLNKLLISHVIVEAFWVKGTVFHRHSSGLIKPRKSTFTASCQPCVIYSTRFCFSFKAHAHTHTHIQIYSKLSYLEIERLLHPGPWKQPLRHHKNRSSQNWRTSVKISHRRIERLASHAQRIEMNERYFIWIMLLQSPCAVRCLSAHWQLGSGSCFLQGNPSFPPARPKKQKTAAQTRVSAQARCLRSNFWRKKKGSF